MLIIRTLCLSMLLSITVGDGGRTNWLNSLSRYLKKIPIYQTTLITQASKTRPRLQAMTQEILRSIPSNTVNLQTAKMPKPTTSIHNPRATTLFITVHDLGNNKRPDTELSNPIEYISQLSTSRIRPKCLMIFLVKNNHTRYQRFFERMWSKKFLDVTVLQLLQIEASVTEYLSPKPLELATVHWFNPFTNRCVVENFSANIKWFPDKLRNMHNYEMKVGMLNNPPSSRFERRSSGDLAHASGVDFWTIESFSKAMNFKMIYVSSEKNEYGILSCSKEENTEYLYQLTHKKIEILITQGATIPYCEFSQIEMSAPTGYWVHVALVPVLKQRHFSLMNRWTLLNALGFILIILITWSFSRFLKFDAACWKLLNIWQVQLGITALDPPQKTKERMIFGIVLLVAFMYSSTFYTALTSIGLETILEFEFKDMRDLNKKNITSVISPNIFRALTLYGNEIEQNVIKRAEQKFLTNTDCVTSMLEKSNRACFLKEDAALMISHNYRDKCNKIVTKIMKQPVSVYFKVIYLEPNSPFVECFNDIINKLLQAGLLRKWNIDFGKRTSVLVDKGISCKKKRESANLKHLLLFCIIVGHTISIIVFVAELFIHYSQNRIKARQPIILLRHPTQLRRLQGEDIRSTIKNTRQKRSRTIVAENMTK